MHDKINEQVESSAEVAQVVTALERQYDAFVAAQENRSLLARDEDLPSGDELGASSSNSSPSRPVTSPPARTTATQRPSRARQ